MFTSKHVEVGWEVAKWIALVALAMLLAFALVSHTAGGPRKAATPGLLPPAVEPSARPIDRTDSVVDSASVEQQGDVGEAIWLILADHRSGDPSAALRGWKDIELPYSLNIWKDIAVAAAHLELGDLDAAEDALGAARAAMPDNAVGHYLTGLLRLEQAELQPDWHDATGSPNTRFVDYRPPEVVPNSASMYRLAAATHLERAIEQANDVPYDRSLIPVEWATSMAVRPTVGDLLWVIGADRFEASAHNALGGEFLSRGAADHAEQHMDRAVAGGANVMYGYRDLGRFYEQQERYADAARAYAKDMRENPGELNSGKKLLENLHKAFLLPRR